MTNSKMTNERGLTIIEVLIVISIVAVIGSSFISLSINFLTSNNLKNITDELISALRTAQANSMYGKGGSNWGVKISESKIFLYKGNSYEGRDQAFDHSSGIPSNITIIQEEDIFFFRRTGTPSATPDITIQTQTGDTNTVSVNGAGAVNVN